MHELMDSASVAVVQLSVALVGGQLDYLTGAVGHVDLELLGSGVGEEHFPLGVSGGGGVVLPHVFNVVGLGSGAESIFTHLQMKTASTS